MNVRAEWRNVKPRSATFWTGRSRLPRNSIKCRNRTTSTVAWLFVYAGVLGAIIQGGLVGRLARRFGEVRLIVTGTLLSFIALGLLPYSPSRGPLLAILAVLAVGQGIAHPSLSALTSKLVDPDQVGGVMGVYQGMSSLARIIGPFWGEVVYGAIGFAWPFRTGAVFMLLASVVAFVALLQMRQRARLTD